MRTSDLFGKGLGEYRQALARIDFAPEWDVRLVDETGRVWPIPPDAISSRTRSSGIDTATWELTLSLIPDELPKGLTVKQYNTLEVDRLMAGVWPYFRGIIDEVRETVEDQDGAPVTRMSVTAYGMLQKAKGYRYNSIRLDPYPDAFSGPMTGVISTQRYTVASAIGAGGTEKVPAVVTYGLEGWATYGGLMISPNANMSPTYTPGVDYTVDVSTYPATITWITDPADTRYMEVHRVEAFVALKRPSPPYWFRIPYGRTLNDLYHTTITGITGPVITIADSTGYSIDLLNLTDGEYVAISIDGQLQYFGISAVNPGAKQVTLSGLPTGAQFGDAVHLGTLDYHPAWDDDQDVQFWTGASSTGTEYKSPRIQPNPSLGMAIPYVAKNADANWPTTAQVWPSVTLYPVSGKTLSEFFVGGSTQKTGIQLHSVEEWIRRLISGNYVGCLFVNSGGAGYTSAPTVTITGGGGTGAAGTAVVEGGVVKRIILTNVGRNYTSTPTVTLTGGGGAGATAQAIRVGAGALLYNPDEVSVEPSGVVLKNLSRAGITLDEFLREMKEQAMAPNYFIHDTPDGKITIKGYRQAATPDWEIRGGDSIQEVDEPEPITAVVIVGKTEPVDQAPNYFTETATNGAAITNPLNALDGNETTKATVDTGVGVYGEWKFKLPAPTPVEVFPQLDSIEVSGQGLLTVYVISPTLGTLYLRGNVRRPLGAGSTASTIKISQEELLPVLRAEALTLVVRVQHNEAGTTAINGEVASIKINVARQSAWRAALTDDATLTTVPSDPEQFGTVWVQPDASKRESYRYAPTSYLKRVLPKYSATGSSQKHRTELREMVGISPQDTRDYAERYEDEHVRAGKTYQVRAPLVDFGELGDTVRLWWPDGSSKDLLLKHQSDGGGPTDTLADYNLVDYSK